MKNVIKHPKVKLKYCYIIYSVQKLENVCKIGLNASDYYFGYVTLLLIILIRKNSLINEFYKKKAKKISTKTDQIYFMSYYCILIIILDVSLFCFSLYLIETIFVTNILLM